jgi:PAS domain S-box-containing protein
MNENLPLKILDSLSEGIITLDKEFKITFINLAAERITGLKKDEIFGTLCKAVFRPDYCRTGCPIRSILETGNSIFNFKNKIITSEKEEIDVKINATVLRDESLRPIGGVISFTDISKMKNVDKILSESSDFYGTVGNSPLLSLTAPVNEPFTCPNNSLASKSDGKTAQFIFRNGLRFLLLVI